MARRKNISKLIYSSERSYSKALMRLPKRLERSFKKIVRSGKLPLTGKSVSVAMILRMRGYYLSQHALKKFLGKRYIGAAADFFVEAVLFYLQALNTSRKLGLEIASEKQIKPKKNAIRPDISIWKNGRVIAMIECKTQLGWNRHDWEDDFLRRKNQLRKDYPKAKSFLLVMTPENWGGFGNSRKLGMEYFVLSKQWPDKVDPKRPDKSVLIPVEKMFKRIIK